jgi:hypothetical protein
MLRKAVTEITSPAATPESAFAQDILTDVVKIVSVANRCCAGYSDIDPLRIRPRRSAASMMEQ